MSELLPSSVPSTVSPAPSRNYSRPSIVRLKSFECPVPRRPGAETMDEFGEDRRKQRSLVFSIWHWLKRRGRNRREAPKHPHVVMFESAVKDAEATVLKVSDTKRRMDEALGGFTDE